MAETPSDRDTAHRTSASGASPAEGTADRQWSASVSQAHAIQLDALSRQTISLATVWQQLVEGSWRAAHAFSTASRMYLKVQLDSRDGEAARRPTRFEIALLQRTLLGERAKAVALDISRSQSTVSSRLGSCLGGMGFSPHISRVPLWLVAAAACSAGLPSPRYSRLTTIEGRGSACAIVSVPRVDRFLREQLTRTEFDVQQLLLDGLPYTEIAEARAASPRTIANQIASIFRKLGISGRPELLLHVVTRAARDESQPSSTTV